jgi:drug/metabolite transporter (DMT)-like permease
MDTALPLPRRTASAHVALVLVVVFWAASFSAIKALLDRGMGAQDIAILRYVVAAPGFALLLWGVGGLPGLARRDAVRLVLAGVAVVTGYHISLNIGTKYTTSGTAALVVALSPALTLLLGAALGLERAGSRRIAGLAVAFVGVAVVVFLGAGADLSFANAKGPLIVIGAPVAFALYNVLLQPLLHRYGLLALTAASSLVGMLGLLPFVRPSTVDAIADMSANSAALILYLGLICTLLGYAAWNVGLRGLGPTRAVSYTYAIPALAVLMGAVFLDEPITIWLAVGGALVLGGVALAQSSQRS